MRNSIYICFGLSGNYDHDQKIFPSLFNKANWKLLKKCDTSFSETLVSCSGRGVFQTYSKSSSESDMIDS